MDVHTAEIGHNLPPKDADPIRDRLTDQYADLMARQTELLASFERAPEIVDDDKISGKFGDLAKEMRTCIANIKTARVSEKDPYLNGGRSVDAFFFGIDGPLKKAMEILRDRSDIYLIAKAEKEKCIAEKAAKVAAEEAARLEAKAKTDADIETAIELTEEARRQEKIATEKPAERARTRGELGSVSTLHTEWVGEILSYDTLDLEALRPHIPRDALDKAVRAYVKTGARQLAGAKIYEKSTTSFR